MQKSRNQRIKELLLKLSDRIDTACHVAGSLIPPKSLSSQYGAGSHAEVGLEFFGFLLDFAGLQRTSSVLDVGCGIGRIALPLTSYLTPAGRYEGFDIMPDGIDYCARVVTPRFGNFRFARADVHNSYYNPGGTTQPEDYRFPHPDDAFDIVISTSVFTHLRPAAIERYVAESRRVLKPGGICLHTCFLIDDETRALIAAGRDYNGFRHQMDGFMTNDLDHVESAIAIPLDDLRAIYRRCGLDAPTIHPGSWSGRAGNCRSHQDLCIASKPRIAA
jgi:SAM-dependent methyltransferase